MNETGHQEEAERFAASLVFQSVWPAALVAGAAAAAPFTTSIFPEPGASPVTRIAWLAAVASGGVTFALSGVVLFDALLLRLIASHDLEATGTGAVDDLLMRMRLKPAPARSRRLSERMAGTRRLLLKQRLALALFFASAFVTRVWMG